MYDEDESSKSPTPLCSTSIKISTTSSCTVSIEKLASPVHSGSSKIESDSSVEKKMAEQIEAFVSLSEAQKKGPDSGGVESAYYTAIEHQQESFRCV